MTKIHFAFLTTATCSFLSLQVAIALQGGEVTVFELEVGTGLLVEAEKRDLGEDVACLEVRRGGACVLATAGV